MREFNVAGSCVPSMHYMVDISDKIKQIRKLIDGGKYFAINRARQYGKTTTRYALRSVLEAEYIVINISFEGIGDIIFEQEKIFCAAMFQLFADSFEFTNEGFANEIRTYGEGVTNLKELGKAITKFTREMVQKVVLIIDEVDKSSNNQLFISFLAMLRDKYIATKNGDDSTFYSIILIGVHDVKNLKAKIRPDAEMKCNSPWNIAVAFEVDMSFSPSEIESMLKDYETENDTQMNGDEISQALYHYTSGYPFLVSQICKVIDEKLERKWTKEGIQEAIKFILDEKVTLFDDLLKNMAHHQDLYNTVYSLVIEGKEIGFDVNAYEMGLMFGILKKGENGKLAIHNKVFEILIYNYLSAMKEIESINVRSYETRNQFIDENGDLKMTEILIKFQELMQQEYRKETEAFLEKEGR